MLVEEVRNSKTNRYMIWELEVILDRDKIDESYRYYLLGK